MNPDEFTTCILIYITVQINKCKHRHTKIHIHKCDNSFQHPVGETQSHAKNVVLFSLKISIQNDRTCMSLQTEVSVRKILPIHRISLADCVDFAIEKING